MPNKTAPFSMRFEEDLKAGLQELADADNRSLTNYIETVLRQHWVEKRKVVDLARRRK